MRPLTPREKQVLQLVCRGLIDKEIADQLHIAYRTVGRYMFELYGKSGILGGGRVKLFIWAVEQGHIPAPKRLVRRR